MDSTPDALLELNDDDFTQLVNDIIRRKSDNYRGKYTVEFLERALKTLRTSELASRWYMVLARTAKSVDGQLSAREADYIAERARLRGLLAEAQRNLKEAQEHGQTPLSSYRRAVTDLHVSIEELTEAYAKQRAGTLRFKSGLDTNLIDARHAYDAQLNRVMSSVAAIERNRAMDRVKQLEAAITAHWNGLDPEDATAADQELWDVLTPA